MNIAQITSVYLSVPPRSHGGTEIVVYNLVQALVSKGHQVELYASGDSVVDAKLTSVLDVATSYDEDCTVYIEKEMEARNTFNLYREANRFDIIHSHWPTLAPYFSNFTRTPTLVTYAYIEKSLHEYYRTNFPNVYPVCISESQARFLGDSDLPVVYNGIDVDQVPFGSKAEDFLIIVGRLTPNKGITDAIRIAKASGERLLIVGAITESLPWSRKYYEEEVAPHVDGDQIKLIPHMSNKDLMILVGRAKAFLFPLQWDEPFGLAVAEALAAGTPVITYPKGSMVELVTDGLNGFVVESEAGACQAISRIGSIDRMQCRESIVARFTIDRMVRDYELLYEELSRRN